MGHTSQIITGINMSKKNIGIIGNGFVGKAQSYAFGTTNKIYVFDTNSSKSNATIDEVHNSDYIFICVPTPMNKNGSQDVSYLEEVFKYSKNKGIYIIKSTVLPSTTDYFISNYPEKKIIFSPEFLTEKNYREDILNQSRIILGGDKLLTDEVEKLYQNRFNKINIVKTDSITAELVKYMNNCFLATKVSIMNEFKLMSDSLGANWNDALYGFSLDKRIGNSHLNVPGHDGDFGYGGTCFPKDVCAFIHLAEKIKINLNTIKAGWTTNLEVRKEKDWIKKSGRSVNF